jgi:hypothetical protein
MASPVTLLFPPLAFSFPSTEIIEPMDESSQLLHTAEYASTCKRCLLGYTEDVEPMKSSVELTQLSQALANHEKNRKLVSS